MQILITEPIVKSCHNIFIANRRRCDRSLWNEFGDIPWFDVTFAGGHPLFSTLSPMYPHGDLPVPFTKRSLTATSLEAVWQGLKVFEYEGALIDAKSLSKFGDKNIKRSSSRKRGKILGHQQGIYAERQLLSLIEARAFIYAPLYRWQLKHKCQEALDVLREALSVTDIVLLEAGIDSDIHDVFTPMTHSALLRLYILGQYPECGIKHPWRPFTAAEHDADMIQRKKEQRKRCKLQKYLHSQIYT